MIHAGPAVEGKDERTGPPVAFPYEVAARFAGLPQSLLCNGSVQPPVVPSGVLEFQGKHFEGIL